MLIHEFRVTLPMTVEEYQVAQLWSVAEASKNETGGGDGVEVIKNEPEDHPKYGKGQFTHKIYHLSTKVPTWVKMLAPKGSLELHEKAWNCYPYCRTELSNPDYMKDNFAIIIETWHKEGRGDLENVHGLEPSKLKDLTVVNIDIANDPYNDSQAKEEEDPAKFHSEKTGRGPLVGDWKKSCEPVMTCYKLVSVEFKWWGLQGKMERYIQKVERQIFTKFHRQLFCWIDQWYGLTMDDIRRIEEETKQALDEQRSGGEARGTKAVEN